MAESLRSGRLSVSPIDSRGRTISPEVLLVAQEIGDRAIRYAERLLGDSAIATSLFEETAATVTRVISTKKQNGDPEIENLAAYLFSAFVRRVNRVRRKELTVLSAFANREPRSAKASSVEELEKEILIEQLLTKCNPVIREMFRRRISGYDWKAIGRVFGISAHAAEARFSSALKTLGKKMRR